MANPRLRWRAGIGYNSSALEDEDCTADNPTGDAWRLTAGVSYTLDGGLEAPASYTLVWFGDMDT
ncbi:MAG: outer membrane protein transport protein [Pseudomonas sp.]